MDGSDWIRGGGKDASQNRGPRGAAPLTAASSSPESQRERAFELQTRREKHSEVVKKSSNSSVGSERDTRALGWLVTCSSGLGSLALLRGAHTHNREQQRRHTRHLQLSYLDVSLGKQLGAAAKLWNGGSKQRWWR